MPHGIGKTPIYFGVSWLKAKVTEAIHRLKYGYHMLSFEPSNLHKTYLENATLIEVDTINFFCQLNRDQGHRFYK